jgi:hypothetical protein
MAARLVDSRWRVDCTILGLVEIDDALNTRLVQPTRTPLLKG